ncbi:CHAD domain-containing protein [Streptomyces sioyaensis]|uniref:CHAD domain-containing protein n=1 Tax=Streptomyces sioyaensis TaxID=67364 RepID=UPI003D751F6A
MTPGGAGVAQRHDQQTGGPAGLIGTGYERGGAPGARSAVMDGPHAEDGSPHGTSQGPLMTYSLGDDGTRAGPDLGTGLTARTAEEVLADYLHQQAADFLRSLRLHRESGSDAEGAGDAARLLRRAARRISATLHTYRPLTDEAWADQLRAELGWLSGALAREQACEARRDRLMAALQRLTGRGERPERPDRGGPDDRGDQATREKRDPRGSRRDRPAPSRSTAAAASPPAAAATTETDPDGALAAGAARAGALLDRQLTLARTRAHSAALQALGSARFHAVADSVAVLASEAPLAGKNAELPAAEALPPLADQAYRRLVEAVAALPLSRAGYPYNAAALAADQRQDAPWHQVRMLVRMSRYAREVLAPEYTDHRLAEAGRALEWHRDAAEAAAAAAAAARTPRIAPATAYALGVLHADQRHEVEAARFAFGRVWLPRAGERPGAGTGDVSGGMP